MTAAAGAQTAATAPAVADADEACPCDAAVVAYLLGWAGAPRTALSKELRATRCLSLGCLASKLRRLGFRVRQAHLSPRRLMQYQQPVVVLLHLPNGHSHFEVYLGFTDAMGSFADPTLASGKARHRDLRLLADIWDGEALIVERGPLSRYVRSLLIWLIPLAAALSWITAWRLLRRSRSRSAV